MFDARPHFLSRFRPDALAILEARIEAPTLPGTFAHGGRFNAKLRCGGFNLTGELFGEGAHVAGW